MAQPHRIPEWSRRHHGIPHRKWTKELDYDTQGQWYRSYGNELWEFDADGIMYRREASINDVPINAVDRRYFGPRTPDEHGLELPLE